MRLGWMSGLFAFSLIAGASAQPLLDPGRLPTTSEAARASYRDHFLIGNLPRAFALAENGRYAGVWGQKSPEIAAETALANCSREGGVGCRLYAQDLAVVWPGLESPPPPAPPARLLGGEGYDFIPDPRFIWHGRADAKGVIVWGHGYSGTQRLMDSRGVQPPAILRPLNNAGYDVVRFDRDPRWDGDIDRVAIWLRDGLMRLRVEGWGMLVAAGQSRGGINALNTLKWPGVVDVVLTTSAANSGTDPGTVATRGETYLYSLLSGLAHQSARVAYIQFLDDPFAGDLDRRARRIREMLAPKMREVLLVDRPEGFHGHGAGTTNDFAQAYAFCVAHFVDATIAVPPGAPSGAPGRVEISRAGAFSSASGCP